MSAVHQSPPAAAEPLVLREDADGIARLTLNRPQARNALSRDLMRALQDQFDAIRADRTVRVVILRAHGTVFSAGHDLKELRAIGDRHEMVALFRQCADLMLSITRLPQPVIAQVHGVATAAGCQLVATCDLAIAGRSARFATPGVNIGLFCSTPMVALSRAVGTKKSMEMLLTGEMIDAETAATLGLINACVPDLKLDEAVDELAAKIAAKSPHVLAIGKEAFYRQRDLDLAAAYAYTAEVMATNMQAADAAEGIDAFLQKRTPTWQGC